VLSSILPYAFF